MRDKWIGENDQEEDDICDKILMFAQHLLQRFSVI